MTRRIRASHVTALEKEVERLREREKELCAQVELFRNRWESLQETRDEVSAQVERLSGQLRAFRKWIEKQEFAAFGVVEETHDCPAYPIRDELIYEITKTINETPAQSLREIRAEAGREGFKAGVNCYEKEGFKFLTPLGLSEMKEYEADQYAQQVREGKE